MRSLKVFDAQNQDLSRSQSADRKNPKHEVLASRCLSQQRAKLLDGEKAFARSLLDIRHDKLARGILFNNVLVHGVLETCFEVRTNLADGRFAVAVLGKLIREQLQRCEGDFARRLVPDDGKNVFAKEIFQVLPCFL